MGVRDKLNEMRVVCIHSRIYENVGARYRVVFESEEDFMKFIRVYGVKAVFHTDMKNVEEKGNKVDREKYFIVNDGVEYIYIASGE